MPDLAEPVSKPSSWLDGIKPVVELFSVISAGAFVASAAVNALRFWFLWNLDYFSIASPSDVIMSGFIPLTLLAVGALGLAGMVYGTLLVTTWLNSFTSKNMIVDLRGLLVKDVFWSLTGLFSGLLLVFSQSFKR